MRILIADDDQTMRLMLSGILAKMGYSVAEACDGREALDLLTVEEAPRLAILDWKMPLLDGVGVVRRLRAMPEHQSTYIIMLTSKSSSDDVVEALDAGANNYLVKPFNAAELKAHIEVGRRMIAAETALAAKNAELQEALDHIRTLRGIIPICAVCKKIRDDKGYWNQVEEYVSKHTEAEFSHGICPGCAHSFYPDIYPPSTAVVL
ncbi:MAG TPA: response regulator [Verrucomicrobia bacterium]|nr:response regulator [Verrucomicrobiota bacterium]